MAKEQQNMERSPKERARNASIPACLALGAMLVATSMAIVAWATAGTSLAAGGAAVGVGSASAPFAQSAPVSLDATNVPPPGLGAFTVDITYDPSIIGPAGCTAAAGFFCNASFAPAKVRCGGFDVNGRNGMVPLCTPNFTSVGQAGQCSNLTLAVVELSDVNGAPMSFSVANGAFCVAAPPTATATSTPTSTATSTPTETPTSTPTATPCGDIDCDGVPDVTDNCPAVGNPDQLNTDAANTALNRPGADPLGDACDGDIDGDGYTNAQEAALGDAMAYCGIMRADVDGDRAVTILDLSVLAQHFLEPVTPATARHNQDADNAITILDLAAMANLFLQSVIACP